MGRGARGGPGGAVRAAGSARGQFSRVNKFSRPPEADGRNLVETGGDLTGLFSRAYRFAALYADRADIDGLCFAVQSHFLFLKVGLEKPLGSPMGMTIGVT